MSPSVPTNVSLSSLDMASSAVANEKDLSSGRATPVTSSGTTSSVSSDLSTASHRDRRAANAESFDFDPTIDKWYYYLTPSGAKALPNYQYNGSDLSPLYKYVLSPLAAWCVDNLTPVWMAPNSITFFGLMWMVTSYCTIWYWCPGMYEANTDLDVDYAVPRVIFLFNGCAMLIYQTLDNMDGKQARKTGSSSPLGLLFDHGCDAMNIILGSANWIAAMALVPGNVSDLLGNSDHGNIQSTSLVSEFFGGDAILAYLLLICPMVAFYITTWEQYYTGKLILPPFNGPSEGLVMGATLSFVSFVMGPMWWQGTSLTDYGIEKFGPSIGDQIMDISFMQGRVRNLDLVVLAAVIAFTQEVSLKTISVVRAYGLQSIRTLVPNTVFVASTLAMVLKDPTMFLQRPRIMMHLMSALFTEQTTQIMLDHMVEEDYGVRGRWCLLLPAVLGAAMMAGVDFSAESLDTTLLVYTTGLWVYLAFKIRVQIYEICDVLGIWCFDIVTPHPKKQQLEAEKKTN